MHACRKRRPFGDSLASRALYIFVFLTTPVSFPSLSWKEERLRVLALPCFVLYLARIAHFRLDHFPLDQAGEDTVSLNGALHVK